MNETVEMIVQEDRVATNCLEKVEDSIAALDGEIADTEGCICSGEEGIVEEGVHVYVGA
jgi:hypothetical protein